jgi:hypothetical protein
MVVSWLIFIAVALLIYAGFVKLAARLLRYSVSWKVSFLFAGIMMVAVIFHHVLLFSAPVALRIGLGVVLLLGLVILGGWFFSGRCTNRQNAVLGWSGGMRLAALAFAIGVVVAFAIVVPVQIFLSNSFSAR